MTFMQHLLVSQATAREAARDVTARAPPPPLGPAWASPGLGHARNVRTGESAAKASCESVSYLFQAKPPLGLRRLGAMSGCVPDPSPGRRPKPACSRPPDRSAALGTTPVRTLVPLCSSLLFEFAVAAAGASASKLLVLYGIRIRGITKHGAYSVWNTYQRNNKAWNLFCMEYISEE